MKILVPIKRVVDYHVKIQVKSDESGVVLDNVKMAINPFDEIAVEEAIRLKEKGIAQEVVVISIGERKCEETLRHALALGADRGILIHLDTELEPLIVAKCLKKIVQDENADLVLMGKQAIDNDYNQTGQLLAGLLDWPQSTFASNIKIQDKNVTVIRELDTGLETVQFTLPGIITADLRLNVPRYPSMPNIMKAKQKPLTILTESEIKLDTAPRLKILSVCTPPKREKGIKVNSTQELLDKLHNDAKVL